MSFRKVALKVIQLKSYPKIVLGATYAAHIYPREMEKWQGNGPFASPTYVKGLQHIINIIPYWYAYPEKTLMDRFLQKGQIVHIILHISESEHVQPV